MGLLLPSMYIYSPSKKDTNEEREFLRDFFFGKCSVVKVFAKHNPICGPGSTTEDVC
jgi:hypothetical protein